jgi:fatty acid desaturase
MNDMPETGEGTRIVTAKSSRRGPILFNLFNIIATLLPFPLMVFWLGASIVLYAMNRHHPNPKVAHYVQWAAYRLYAIAGLAVPVATFFSVSLTPWLVYWAFAAIVMIPWSILDLIRIKRDTWEDTVIQRSET